MLRIGYQQMKEDKDSFAKEGVSDEDFVRSWKRKYQCDGLEKNPNLIGHRLLTEFLEDDDNTTIIPNQSLLTRLTGRFVHDKRLGDAPGYVLHDRFVKQHAETRRIPRVPCNCEKDKRTRYRKK